MSKIGNKELAKVLCEKYELNRAASELFVSTMFEVINDGLKYDKQVKVKGLGTFKVTSVASRKSVDVNTGEPIVIEGRDKINFTADTSLRDRVNRPFAQFETVVVNESIDFDEIDRRYADSMIEKEEPNEMDEGEDTISTESLAEDLTSRNETDQKASLPNADVQESVTPSPTLAEEGAEPLVLNTRHLTLLNQEGHSKTQTVPEEQASGTVVASPNTNDNFEPDESDEVAAMHDDTSGIKVLSLNMEQLAVLNGIQKVQKQVKELVTPLCEQSQQQEPKSAEHRSEIDEELERVKYRTEELTEVVERQHRYVKLLMGIAALLAVVCVGGWVYMGTQLEKRNNRIRHLEAETMTLKTSDDMAVSTPQSADSVAIKKAQKDSMEYALLLAKIEKGVKDTARQVMQQARKEQVATKKADTEGKPTLTKETPKVEKQKPETAKQNIEKKEQVPSQTAYEKDARVRTGAYYIMGIDQTVTARSGQTLAGISKAYLGAGMECYVEAVNGGRKEVKAGDKINIPKLKLKKK